MPDARAVWARLRESLWFVPTLIVGAAIVLAVGLIELSTMVDDEALSRWPRIFGAGADGSRSMLSAIAGSMITVAGVTFSITMVAVTQASTQYTPRILRNFMRDRANQAVLGIFVGIFAYCLVVLRTIRSGDESEFVPSLAVLVGVLLAIVGIAVLIFFVHHIATTLQASEIISRITHGTRQVVDRLYPDEVEAEQPFDLEPSRLQALVPAEGWQPVPARETGYIQRADLRGMVRAACDDGLMIRLAGTPGDFAIEGQPMAFFARHPVAANAPEARKAKDVARVLAADYVVGTYRTLDQDAGFGIRQLVDIALKALSPGINDTTTAVTCVDYLGAVLTTLGNRRIDIAHRDEDGTIRVVAERPTFDDLLGLAVDEIRQNAGGNVSVLGQQLEMLGMVAKIVRSKERRRAVARHIELVQETAAATVSAAYDRERVQRLARKAADAASD